MANTIKHKRSSSTGETPDASDLSVGEIAVNTADGLLFTKHTDNAIVTLTTSGPTGPTGPTGPAGPAGSNGSAGADGNDGPTGPAGPAGSDGSNGGPGPTGPAGPAGSDGSNGGPGPTGPAGPAGSNGSNGGPGPAGPPGPGGGTGPTGPTGATGSFFNTFGSVLSTMTNPEANTFRKTSSNANWNGRVYSTEGYPQAYMTTTPTVTGHVYMAGLTADPTASTSYNTIDYAWYANGTWRIYENGTSVGSYGTYGANDVASIVYDGDGFVRYYINGVVKRTRAITHGTNDLHFASSTHTINKSWKGHFGPNGKQGGVGPSGSNGGTGPTGPPGSGGGAGPPGPPGSDGSDGSNGGAGPPGPAGPNGGNRHWVTSGDKYGKFRLWGDSDTYGIGMYTSQSHGSLADYAMTFQMSNTDARGFVWRDTGMGNNQGAMSLTTNGLLNVAGKIKVGGGISDTASHSTTYEFETVGDGYFSGELTVGSDRRIKDNITDLDNALDIVKQLEGKRFTKIANPDKPLIGLIAQDVEKHLPEVVTYDDQADSYGVSYGSLTALLIEAVKEQQAKIEALEQKIAGGSQ